MTLTGAILRGAALAVVLASAGPAAAAPDCREETALGRDYLVCTADPAKDRIVMAVENGNGAPYGRFGPFVDAEAARGRTVLFAMNGGMYDGALRPIGLYVENGQTLKPANTRTGPGNFHLLPNGVFYVKDGRAGVMETKRFVASGIAPDFATQSGPMLVISGKFHPRFLKDSDSRKIRNGVGVAKADGAVTFAVSKQPVTFWEFATLFRDTLGCDDALFLDGTISSVYAPEAGRRDFIYPIGPIIAVVE